MPEKFNLPTSWAGNQDRYHQLLDAIDEGFCVVEVLFDQHGMAQDYRFVEVNAAFEKQTGIVGGLGKRMRQIAPNHEDSWFQNYGQVAVTREPLRFENEARQLNRWFDVFAFPVDEPWEHKVAVLFKDITERKKIETALTESIAREQAVRQRAEATNRQKDQFLALISHELRTPLSAILSWAVLLRSKELDSAAGVKAVEIIERNARVQHRLIEDLMDLSRICAGKIRMEFHPVELAPVIQVAVESLRPEALKKRVRLETTLEPFTEQISGDAARLQQIVWNLVSNAIKFTPADGVVKVSTARLASHVEISVSDSGSGITAEFLPHVFERFSQDDTTNRNGPGGIGLGLAIVKHLVELHGGEIRAASAGKGQGALFTVRLPLRVARP